MTPIGVKSQATRSTSTASSETKFPWIGTREGYGAGPRIGLAHRSDRFRAVTYPDGPSESRLPHDLPDVSLLEPARDAVAETPARGASYRTSGRLSSVRHAAGSGLDSGPTR